MQVLDLANRSKVDEYNQIARRENRRMARSPLNQPDDYSQLKYLQQRCLLLWIKRTFTACNRAHVLNSYAWKHYFENDEGGFYITNGQFKGAMLAAGYRPTKATVNEINWRFRVKPIRDLSHIKSI